MIAAAMANSVTCETGRQWEQVLARDPRANFVYAVTTTGIFCRPGCPSRRPAREHVRFFADAQAAGAAGFRACLRCCPQSETPASLLAKQVSAHLRDQLDRRVSLAELGRLLGVSPYTVQRVFTRTTGLSPRAYANELRAARYRSALQQGEAAAGTLAPAASRPRNSARPVARITDAVYVAGFSGTSRAHHAAPLGMAAKSYRARGRGEQIGYMVAPVTEPAGNASTHPTHALGMVLVAATPRGICAVLLGSDAAELARDLRDRFAGSTITEDPLLQSQMLAVLQTLHEPAAAAELPLDLRATAFQARVWAALAAIPRGETRTYAQVAAQLGKPRAVRAVARACSQNPAALLVPCHRVLGSNGSLTGYRWGVERKRLLLALEQQETPGSR